MTFYITMVCGLAITATSTPEVTNPGFENISKQSGLPTDWLFTSIPGKLKLVQYEAKALPDNKKSQVLSITVAKDHPKQQVAYNVHQNIKGIATEKTYRVSAKVQTRGLNRLPMVAVQCTDKTGRKYLAFARSTERKLKQDIKKWEQIDTIIKVPTGTSIFKVRIGITTEGNAGGTAFIDDVKVTEIK